MTPYERAVNAQQIIDNPVFHEAMAEVKSRLLSLWEATNPDQWKERESLFAQLQALKDIRQQLDIFVHTAALDSTAKVKHGRTEGYNV